MKPERNTYDSVVLYDAMLTVVAKFGVYDRQTVNMALDWLEASFQEENEPETAKAIRAFVETVRLEGQSDVPYVK